MKEILRLLPVFEQACLNKDPSSCIDRFRDNFYSNDIDDKMEMCWVNDPVVNGDITGMIYSDGVPYGKEYIEQNEMFLDPTLSFKNLKILKSYIQKNGTVVEKEAILEVIKMFKQGDVKC